MVGRLINKKANFGTMPVFMTAISTILGAILFLRFGYAVGHVGFVGVLGIILIGHLITVPTALAVAEIATNQKVQGGGAYYIISRSFGLNIGAAIGIALFLSQAISVAFYVIAFAEAFDPIIDFIFNKFGFLINKKMISLPTMGILSYIILTRGANMGMKALYVVVALLFTSLLMFFFGRSQISPEEINFSTHIENPDNFFYVFTIVFPAFTGLAAGLGLSGDLKNPKKSIPQGTIIATIVGIVVYVFVAYKLTISASSQDLANDQLIMQKIAIWGPIIPIGLAAASLSSALGSIIVAPRTLQAIGVDNIFPNIKINKWFSKGKPISNEPVNASVITVIIAFVFISIGDIDFVAKIISMFFIVTYGAICLISFLEHFAADPSYRPTFRSRWYFSLLGAVLSLWLMFKMNMPYAILSLLIMGIIYYTISIQNKDKKGLGNLFRGVVFQLSRQLQVFAQRADKEDYDVHWRPFIICISHDTFKRRSAFDLLRWVSYKYGFGTYIHYIEGFLTNETHKKSKDVLSKLINLASGSKNRVYLDTIISPSYTSAIAQVIQLTSISGKVNNMILFEFSKTEPEAKNIAISNYPLIRSADFDVCVLNTSYKGFGYKKEIHIWITSEDYENANLMILLGYIILGHPEWRKGFIKIFAIYPKAEIGEQKQKILSLIKSGRLPISPGNVELIPSDKDKNIKNIIAENSIDSDLTIIGFRNKSIKKSNAELFEGYGDIGNILFVNSNKEKPIELIDEE
ncbi:MAG: hypothetical protein KAT68_09365 [Bacteroidales bacterium]|nr:hypothetical protein [Bacteroidales bacterium]